MKGQQHSWSVFIGSRCEGQVQIGILSVTETTPTHDPPDFPTDIFQERVLKQQTKRQIMFLRLWGARLNLLHMEFRISHLKLDFPLYRSNFQQCVHIRMEIFVSRYFTVGSKESQGKCPKLVNKEKGTRGEGNALNQYRWKQCSISYYNLFTCSGKQMNEQSRR